MSAYSIKKQIPWKVNLLTYWRIANDNSKSYSSASDKLNVKQIEFLVFIHSVVDSDGKIIDNDLIDRIECLSFSDNPIYKDGVSKSTQMCFLSNSAIRNNQNPVTISSNSDDAFAVKQLSFTDGRNVIYDDSEIKFKPCEDFKLNNVGSSDITHEVDTESFNWLYNGESPVLKKEYMWTDASIRNDMRRKDFYNASKPSQESGFNEYDYYADNQNLEYYNNYDKRSFFYDEDMINTDIHISSSSYSVGGTNADVLRNLFFRITFKTTSNEKIKLIESGNNPIKTTVKGIGTEITSILAVASNPFILPSSIFKKGFLENDDLSIDVDSDSLFSFSIYKKDIKPCVIFHSDSKKSENNIKQEGVKRINNKMYNLVYTSDNMWCENIKGSDIQGDILTFSAKKDFPISTYSNPLKKIQLVREKDLLKSNIRNCRVDELGNQKYNDYSNHIETNMKKEIKSMELAAMSIYSNPIVFMCMPETTKNYIKTKQNDSAQVLSLDYTTKNHNYGYVAKEINKKTDLITKSDKYARYFVGMTNDSGTHFFLNTNTVKYDDVFKKDSSDNYYQFFGGNDNISSHAKPCILFHGVYNVKLLDASNNEVS